MIVSKYTKFKAEKTQMNTIMCVNTLLTSCYEAMMKSDRV